MRAGRVLLAATSFVAAGLMSYGCGSSSSDDTSDASSKDAMSKEAGKDTSPAPDVQEGGKDGGKDSASMACTPEKTPVDLIPWAPPTAFHEGKCDKLQASLYAADWQENNTAAFRADSKNATCLTCIETPAGASAHGPVITPELQANFGGCAAHYDGDVGAKSCGALINDYETCAFLECGDCPDYIKNGPMTMACLETATGKGGLCENDLSLSCESQLASGGVAEVCSNLKDFLYLWCGSSEDGGLDGSTTDSATD
jgi:hypothetical protein